MRALAIARTLDHDLEAEHLEHAEYAADAGGRAPALELADETQAEPAGGGEIALGQAEGFALATDDRAELGGGVDGEPHDPDRGNPFSETVQRWRLSRTGV